jgi:hypothetical protein
LLTAQGLGFIVVVQLTPPALVEVQPKRVSWVLPLSKSAILVPQPGVAVWVAVGEPAPPPMVRQDDPPPTTFQILVIMELAFVGSPSPMSQMAMPFMPLVPMAQFILSQKDWAVSMP